MGWRRFNKKEANRCGRRLASRNGRSHYGVPPSGKDGDPLRHDSQRISTQEGDVVVPRPCFDYVGCYRAKARGYRVAGAV